MFSLKAPPYGPPPPSGVPLYNSLCPVFFRASALFSPGFSFSFTLSCSFLRKVCCEALSSILVPLVITTVRIPFFPFWVSGLSTSRPVIRSQVPLFKVLFRATLLLVFLKLATHPQPGVAFSGVSTQVSFPFFPPLSFLFSVEFF